MARYVFIVLLFLSVSTAFSQYRGKITKVEDGETLWITLDNGDEEKVRLYGIDSPELDQEFGVAAKKNLENYLHHVVDLEYKSRDSENYMLAIVTYKTKEDEIFNLNQELVKAGFAWRNKYSDDKDLAKLEKQAKKNNMGLWRNSEPIPPWEWRKHHQKD